MTVSRRKFLTDALALAGVMSLPNPLGASTPDRPGGFTSFEPAYLKLEKTGELARREKKIWKLFEKCTVCPRKCEVKRLAGESDVCSSTQEFKVASAGPHFGEEKPLVGEHGSGTIFFSNCSLLCVFCQNWEIAHRGDGGVISHSRLADAMMTLQKRGCHNINLVTPSHVVPHIVRALRIAISQGLRLPLVYNTGGYDSLQTIQMLDGIIDIYMPDFKYQDGKLAHKYSREAGDYPEVAAAAIKEMHRQVGALKTDRRGVATRGVILRHLVMPNNVSGTDKFVSWVAKELSRDTYVNLMAQYRPAHKAFDHPQIARRITLGEWKQALAWAGQAGLTNLDR
jgi:putative pyruvate formate lyase activating enzyme